jgi:hypothetical protein
MAHSFRPFSFGDARTATVREEIRLVSSFILTCPSLR